MNLWCGGVRFDNGPTDLIRGPLNRTPPHQGFTVNPWCGGVRFNGGPADSNLWCGGVPFPRTPSHRRFTVNLWCEGVRGNGTPPHHRFKSAGPPLNRTPPHRGFTVNPRCGGVRFNEPLRLIESSQPAPQAGDHRDTSVLLGLSRRPAVANPPGTESYGETLAQGGSIRRSANV